MINFRKAIHPAYLKLMDAVEKYEPKVVNQEKLDKILEEYSENGISFCINHTNVHDIPVSAKAIKEHFYVMIAKEGLTSIQKLAFILNGAIFIKRDNKKSRRKAQESLIKRQKRKMSTFICPEACWNVKDNKYMNKLYVGIINASKETDAPIVPIILEYVSGECYALVGDVIKVDKKTDSRVQADNLRDIMSTMRFELLSEVTDIEPKKAILKEIEYMADNWDKLPNDKMEKLLALRRKLINIKNDLSNEFNKKIEDNWEESNLDRKFEETCVYKDMDSPDEVFDHLNNIKPTEKTKFLFNENLSGYRK